MQTQYTFVPTAVEWREGLELTRERRTTRGADIAKTVVLSVLVLYCWIPFFLDGCREWNSFVLGVVALLLLLALWIVPAVSVSHDARQIAASGTTVRLTVFEDTLGFGEGERFSAIPFAEIDARFGADVLALVFEGGQMTVLPRRCFSEDTWQFLCERLSHEGVKPNWNQP